jgi:hypothetical protein
MIILPNDSLNYERRVTRLTHIESDQFWGLVKTCEEEISTYSRESLNGFVGVAP